MKVIHSRLLPRRAAAQIQGKLQNVIVYIGLIRWHNTFAHGPLGRP